MRKVLIHIGIAVLCAAIGVSIWAYVNNLIFPAKPVLFELEEQLLKSSDILEPDEMLGVSHIWSQLSRVFIVIPVTALGKVSGREKDWAEDLFANPLWAAEHLALVQDDSVFFTVERDGETLEIASQFEVAIPGLKERSGELLKQRHYW